MFQAIKKMLSFHMADLFGIFIGLGFIYMSSDTDLFYLVLSPQLYIVIFLMVFLFHSWIWIFGYHGETAYIKATLLEIVKDFFRLILAIISMIGVYFLFRSFL